MKRAKTTNCYDRINASEADELHAAATSSESGTYGYFAETFT